MASDLLTMKEVEAKDAFCTERENAEECGPGFLVSISIGELRKYINAIRALHTDGLKACEKACERCNKHTTDSCILCPVYVFRAKLNAMGGSDGTSNVQNGG